MLLNLPIMLLAMLQIFPYYALNFPYYASKFPYYAR